MDSAGVENHCSNLPKPATGRPRRGLVLPPGGPGSTAGTLELPALENTSRRQPLRPVPAAPHLALTIPLLSLHDLGRRGREDLFAVAQNRRQ